MTKNEKEAGEIVGALRFAQDRICRHAGFRHDLLATKSLQEDHDTPEAGPVLSLLERSALKHALLVSARTVEKHSGSVPQALNQLQRRFEASPEKYGPTEGVRTVFHNKQVALEAEYKAFVSSEAFQKLWEYRSKRVAHYVWGHTFEASAEAGKTTMVPGPEVHHDELLDALTIIAQLCDDTLVLLGSDDERSTTLIERHRAEAARFWAALPTNFTREDAP